MKKIGVGIIGANPDRSWAALAHIPALRALPQYEVVALSTSRPESAIAAEKAYGIPSYSDAARVLEHPGVELAVVSVKVPNHFELVSAALDAGKMVYCEWPLAVNVEQASVLEAKARKLGIRTVVGLQGRFAPAVQHARRLLNDGYIGDILSTTLVGSGMAWGGETSSHGTYLFDESNGATTLSVPLMHALDTLTHVVGEFEMVQSLAALRRPFVHVKDSGSQVAVTAPDQVIVSGRLLNGALASIQYRGGLSRAGDLYWQINGSKGDLAFTANMGNIQTADLQLLGGRDKERSVAPIPVPDEMEGRAPAGFASNVHRLYSQFASDLECGTKLAPDFSYALARHQLLEVIRLAFKKPCVNIRGLEDAL